MKTLIQITGVRYTCKENELAPLIATLEEQRPEVLLVTEQTHDFGIIVRALIGTQYRGVVSRFDLEQVLRMMQHDGTSVLVGQVAETDTDGQCFSVSISGDYPTPDCHTPTGTDLWADWHWTGAPLMDNSPDERRLDISLKVALAELRRNGSINRQTLLQHLDIVLQLEQWDISHETQTQLSEIRQLVSQHTERNVRALATKLRHTLTALGSRKRTKEFQDTYLPQLCQSQEAERMYRQWYAIHKTELSDVRQWQPTITRQLQNIDNCLMNLPLDLCYQKDQFGELMHRLLYTNVPRRKLLMLLSAIVLRKQLRKLLGLSDDETNANEDEAQRQLVLQLAPIFHGNTDSARDFLLLAKGQKTTDITQLVSHWVKEKRICPDHCHRPLWTALHNAGIYKATESNWNMQLDIRKAWR